MRLRLWLFCVTIRVGVIVLVFKYYNEKLFSTPSAYAGLLASGGFLWSDLTGKKQGFFRYKRWWIGFPHFICYLLFYALCLKQNSYSYVPLAASLVLSFVSQVLHTTKIQIADRQLDYRHR